MAAAPHLLVGLQRVVPVLKGEASTLGAGDSGVTKPGEVGQVLLQHMQGWGLVRLRCLAVLCC